jgi:hypothetical protein
MQKMGPAQKLADQLRQRTLQVIHALDALTIGFLQMHHWPILARTTLKIKKQTILKRVIKAL